jgi:hypothetical protein
MRRREFVSLAGVALLWSRASIGQQSTRIAVVPPSAPVSILSANGPNRNWRMFFTELDRLEFTERYSGEGRSDEYAELAKVV